MKVVVIGGGPAGMMAAISASEKRNEVLLLEKNKTLGKKLLITGKGRCNITSSLNMDKFIKNIPGNRKIFIQCISKLHESGYNQFFRRTRIKDKDRARK